MVTLADPDLVLPPRIVPSNAIQVWSQADWSIVALSMLRSRGFVEEFIANHEISRELLRKSVRFWQVEEPLPHGGDSRHAAVDRFHRHVMSVVEDRRRGTVSIRVRWYDAEKAAEWANQLADDIDLRVRAKWIHELEEGGAY